MHYVRNAWYVACFESELADGSPRATVILGEPVVLWRADDRIVAMEDRCVHRAAALSLGKCEGNTLRCMYHGLAYNADGKVVEIPGQAVIPPNAKVKCYPVTVRYGWIWIWMGDRAKADFNLIPGLPGGLRTEDFDISGNALDYNTEARLINDNLLDFSHLTYVHASSFQVGSEWVSSPMSVKPLPNGVRFERRMDNAPGPGFLDNLNDKCDSWIAYDYLVPGVLMMLSGSWPAGKTRNLGLDVPDLKNEIDDALYLQINIQAVTPVSERSARYYYLASPHRNFLNLLTAKQLVDLNTMAFMEDKVVIEAQQTALDRKPDFKVMPTVHDRGVTSYNRLIGRLIAEEHESEGT